MSAVAVVGSDKFALKWGPMPVLLGIVAYLRVSETSRRRGAAEFR